MKIKSLLLATLLGFASLQGMAQAETLKVGVEAMFPPFESKDANGKLVGFDVELNDAICAKMNVTCEWVETSFDGLIPALNARKFDFINSAMNITEPRKKVIDFTDPIYNVPTQLVTKKGETLDYTVETLKAKNITVGVLQGSAQENYARKHWQAKGIKVISYANQDQVFADLSGGRIHTSLQKTPSATDGFLSRPEGKDFELVAGFAEDPEVLGVGTGLGVRKGNDELMARLNKAIAELKQEGFISELSKRYFHDDWVAK